MLETDALAVLGRAWPCVRCCYYRRRDDVDCSMPWNQSGLQFSRTALLSTSTRGLLPEIFSGNKKGARRP